FRRRPWSDEQHTGLVVAAILVPPVLFVAWYVIWRRMNPSAARLALLRRSKAVRDALDRIAFLAGGRVFGDELSRIVRTFLHERMGLPTSAVTPPDVANYLRQRGVSPELVARAEQ